MFDPKSEADIIALNSELYVNPISMLYEMVTESTQYNLDQLNLGENNVGGETTSEILTVEDLYNSFTLTEYDGLKTGDQSWVDTVLNRDFEVEIEFLRVKLSSIFTNVDAGLRLVSRAEVLFDIGSNIDKKSYLTARDMGAP